MTTSRTDGGGVTCGRWMAAAFMLLIAAGCATTVPIDAEVGRDVGDGHVRYNLPYDPKTVKAMTFVAPTSEHPYYEIVVPLGDLNEGLQTTVRAVRANGVPSDSYYAFVDGTARSHDQTVTRSGSAAPNVVVVTRSVWHDSESTTVEVDLAAAGSDGTPKQTTRTMQATAPSAGGVPAGWRRYQSLHLRETAGIDRVSEPVEFSIAERADYVGDLAGEMRIFRVNPQGKTLDPVPFQAFNAQSYAGNPPGGGTTYINRPAKSIEAVFLADVPARQSRVYVVVYDNPSATAATPPATDLVVTGNVLGAAVENRYYKAWLSEQSGCLSRLLLKSDGRRSCPVLTNSLNHALHWNPDSYGDNGQWGHVFGWNPPDRVVVAARGPLLFRITLSGRMPDYTPQVHASVSYSFYAGTPYVRVTTVTSVRDPFIANALRNGELVVDSHLVDHFVWEEKTGELRRIRTLHGPNFQDEWADRVDHDAHWLAMTNELDGYGIGVAVADSLAFNPEHGEATTHRNAYYLYYHHRWHVPLTYFTRAWVYPFSDYQKGPNRPVTPGSTYVERMGIVPFYLRDGIDRYRGIAIVGAQLRHPLAQRWGR